MTNKQFLVFMCMFSGVAALMGSFCISMFYVLSKTSFLTITTGATTILCTLIFAFGITHLIEMRDIEQWI